MLLELTIIRRTIARTRGWNRPGNLIRLYFSLYHTLTYEIFFPWMHIVVVDVLSRRLLGEMLLKVTAKAAGMVRALGLWNCTKITEDVLLAVVIGNLNIEKLDLTRCTGLTPGVINVAEALSINGSGLKCLKVVGIYNLHKGHLQTLRLRLGTLFGEGKSEWKELEKYEGKEQ